ncbi:hypothetical protein JXR93_05700 [bacterium]|nr:hypothetical protein [bacterium]
MKNIILIVSLMFAIFALSCQTIYIHNDKGNVEYESDVKQFHHDIIFGFVETSESKNIQEICPNNWRTIKTETSFLGGLLNIVTAFMWNPEDFEAQCD